MRRLASKTVWEGLVLAAKRRRVNRQRSDKMSKKLSFSGTPKDTTPSYDAGDPAVKAKGFQLTEKSEGVELHKPDRNYSFSKVSNATTSESSFVVAHSTKRSLLSRKTVWLAQSDLLSL